MAASSRAESKMYTASYSRDNAAILLWSFRPPRVASAGGGWLQQGRRRAGRGHYFVTAKKLSWAGGSGQPTSLKSESSVLGHWSLVIGCQEPMTNDQRPITRRSDVESEQQDIPILHDVLFALRSHHSFLLRALPAP